MPYEAHAGLANSAEVAEYLGVTVQALASMRYLSKGPDYVKLGRNVRYRWSDVDAWIAANVQNVGR
jgi:predicted DNA-binding transcriptional regulator AlpA